MRNLSWLQTCISIVLFFFGINGVRIKGRSDFSTIRTREEPLCDRNVSVVEERGREEG